MQKLIRIGTRESQLAVWQATRVQQLMTDHGFASELVFIQSEGDVDLYTPLYEIGVQGIFTRSLDTALLQKRIDIAVHSMKDVPTLPALGIRQAAVLPRANPMDLLVYNGDGAVILEQLNNYKQQPNFPAPNFSIATSSIRRKAQWLNRYPSHLIENLRGNVNTRLRKLSESHWNGAIFASAGLERIDLRPSNSIELDWMLPAPAQGVIMVVCREEDLFVFDACRLLNDEKVALCTKIERDFLRTLQGGCSTPIGALAEIEDDELYFRGNILTPDGRRKAGIEKIFPVEKAEDTGKNAAMELLLGEGREIAESFQHEGK
jgi:hydroxymethylbilane synthase